MDCLLGSVAFVAVAPARERGLKSRNDEFISDMRAVAPARERGLKSDEYFDKAKAAGSLPRGSVD